MADDTKNKISATAILNKIIWHPLFGITIGALIAVYFYFAGIKKPELTYYVSPTRTAIVQSNNLNNFEVSLNGIKIKGELSSAEIQIWNQGGAPIHHADILKPVCLRTENGEPIFQTTTTASRDVIGFSLVAPSNQLDVLSMDWKVMEHNDGIKIQVIYGGDVNVKFFLDGIIEGQPEGFSKYTPNDLNKPSKTHLALTVILFACSYYVMKRITKYLPENAFKTIDKIFPIEIMCFACGLIVIVLVNNLVFVPGYGLHTRPPFGL